MASGYEKHDCGLDPNYGWAGDPSIPTSKAERLGEWLIIGFALTVGFVTLLGKLTFLWEGIKWLMD